ncbi:hypothetical protein UACE39S_02322 [Ureibacillus acetophenoni]
MNAISIVIGAICILVIAYRFYGIFFTNKVLKINDNEPTPAHELNDGKDYVPTNKWVAFGHHFAAIARSRSISWSYLSCTVRVFAWIVVVINRGSYWWGSS